MLSPISTEMGDVPGYSLDNSPATGVASGQSVGIDSS